MVINWVTALQGKAVEDAWKYLSTELKSAMDGHNTNGMSLKEQKT